MRRRRCAPSCAPAVTWSRCGSRRPTSSPRCWMRTGPAPKPSSPTWNRRSAWSSSPATRPRPPPRTWVKADGRVLRQARLLRPPHRRQLLTRLRSAPAGGAGEALTEAIRDAVLAAVAVLAALNASVKNLDRSTAAHLGEHPDSAIFTSLPRSGQVNAAQVLAEWGDARPAYSTPTPSPPSPGSPPSPANPASTAPCTSAGPATSDSASRPPPSPTTPARQPLGREVYNDARASGKTTRTRSTSLPAPRSASSSAARSQHPLRSRPTRAAPRSPAGDRRTWPRG